MAYQSMWIVCCLMCPLRQLERIGWCPEDAPYADVSGSIDLDPLQVKPSASSHLIHPRLSMLTYDISFHIFMLHEPQILQVALLEGDRSWKRVSMPCMWSGYFSAPGCCSLIATDGSAFVCNLFLSFETSVKSSFPAEPLLRLDLLET